MVTTVRGQAGHPIYGPYRVSYYGAETEGRSGIHTRTVAITLKSIEELYILVLISQPRFVYIQK